MRMILVAASCLLLAGCGGAATNNATTAGNDADANAAAPAGDAEGAKPSDAAAAAATPATGPVPPGDLADPRRASEIQECVADVRTEVPEGTDLNAFCGCAVDRMSREGTGERESMEACARQLGIQPR